MVKSLLFPMRYAQPHYCLPYRVRLPFGWYLHWDFARYHDGARSATVRLFWLP